MNYVLNVVICFDVIFNIFLYVFLVGIVIFNCWLNFVDEFWVGNGDFEVGVLGIVLEFIDVFLICNGDGMNSWLMLGNLCFEICFVGVVVLGLEVDWCSNVEVVFEVSNV